MKHRNQKQKSYDYYEKCSWIRAMIYMITKPNMRTQRYKSISNMGVLNTNHACHRTNNHGIYHFNHETTKHAKNEQAPSM